jgi:hypothetical protein
MFLRMLLGLLLFSSPGKAEINLGIGGLTLHGSYVDPEVAREMPNKLDQKGRWVLHPVEVSITEKFESLQYFGAFLRDSINQPAMMLGSGLHSEAGRFDYGFLLGVYLREMKTWVGMDGKSYTTSSGLVNGFGGLQVSGYQLFPMALVTASYKITDLLILSVGTNWFLTHFQLGFYF